VVKSRLTGSNTSPSVRVASLTGGALELAADVGELPVAELPLAEDSDEAAEEPEDAAVSALVAEVGGVVPWVDDPALHPESATAPNRTAAAARVRMFPEFRVIAMPSSGGRPPVIRSSQSCSGSSSPRGSGDDAPKRTWGE
jgi:hypothetical protein